MGGILSAWCSGSAPTPQRGPAPARVDPPGINTTMCSGLLCSGYAFRGDLHTHTHTHSGACFFSPGPGIPVIVQTAESCCAWPLNHFAYARQGVALAGEEGQTEKPVSVEILPCRGRAARVTRARGVAFSLAPGSSSPFILVTCHPEFARTHALPVSCGHATISNQPELRTLGAPGCPALRASAHHSLKPSRYKENKRRFSCFLLTLPANNDSPMFGVVVVLLKVY